MHEMVIYGVSFDLVGKQPIVLLKTADGNRFLPIWIGHPEAAAILMKLQGASTPRPMTHDLLADVLDQLDCEVVRITVTELRENTFYASITVQQNGSEIEIDSRPSDAGLLKALALPDGPFKLYVWLRLNARPDTGALEITQGDLARALDKARGSRPQVPATATTSISPGRGRT